MTATCSSAWYTKPVTVIWQADPAPTAVAPCQLGLANEFTTDTPVTVLACTATWSDGTSASYSFPVRVETSSPTATASLSRPPDSNGWYDHAVTISFAGTAFSGIASCTPTTTYAGPSAVNATFNGSCTDNAGKTATASISLNYDNTPPTITGAVPSRRPDSNGYYTHPVTFRFTGTDAVSGIANCDTVPYSGPASGSVTGGCYDLAGNYANITVPVRYRRAAPVASVSRAGSSLVLRWRPTSGATYYNVQIYRGGKKVLSSWPAHASLLLRRSWSFGGRRFRLRAGRYRWYVWPGYGSRASARYGRTIVSRTFTVSKRG